MMNNTGRKHTNPSIRQIAKELRKNMTPAERLLWEKLRDRRFAGLKFRRQAPIGAYIADFYHAETRLVIEIDGGIRAFKVESDELRSRHFSDFGYKVIRFDNLEVEKDIHSGLQQILDKIVEIKPTAIDASSDH